MAIYSWQLNRFLPRWYSKSTLLDTGWDDWDNFYIEWRDGAIQMSDTLLDSSGDSLQSFDTHNTLATRTERGIAYLDRSAALVKARHKALYIPTGRRGSRKGRKNSHPRIDKGISRGPNIRTRRAAVMEPA